MNLSVKTKIAKPCFGRTPQSLFPIYFMIHDGQHISFRIKPRRNHMHHIRHENDRDCEVGENAVRFLDQRQQAELGDEEVCDAASEGGEDLGAADAARCFWFSASLCKAGVDSFDHGGNHVDGCGYGTEDDQYGNQRCHEFTADALLNHK